MIYTEALPNALLRTIIVAPASAAPPVLLTRAATRVRLIPRSHIAAPAATLNVYTHAIPESQKLGVDKVAEMLFPKCSQIPREYRERKAELIDAKCFTGRMEPRAGIEPAT